MNTVVLRPIELPQADYFHQLEQTSSRWPWTLSALQQSITGDHHCQAILSAGPAGNSDVGYAVLAFMGDTVELLQLVIFQSFQRQRFGVSALQELIAYSAARGAGEMWLEVRASNLAAIRLYLAAGFAESARRKDYYAPVSPPTGADCSGHSETGLREDAILMSRRIQPGENAEDL